MRKITDHEKKLLIFVLQASPGDYMLCSLGNYKIASQSSDFSEMIYKLGYIYKVVEKVDYRIIAFWGRTLKPLHDDIALALNRTASRC